MQVYLESSWRGSWGQPTQNRGEVLNALLSTTRKPGDCPPQRWNLSKGKCSGRTLKETERNHILSNKIPLNGILEGKPDSIGWLIHNVSGTQNVLLYLWLPYWFPIGLYAFPMGSLWVHQWHSPGLEAMSLYQATSSSLLLIKEGSAFSTCDWTWSHAKTRTRPRSAKAKSTANSLENQGVLHCESHHKQETT